MFSTEKFTNVEEESTDNIQEEEQYQDDIDEDKIANIQYENLCDSLRR